VITDNETIESITNALVYFIGSHCTETLQWHCYNNGNDHFSCNDWNAFNDFIMCDCGFTPITDIGKL